MATVKQDDLDGSMPAEAVHFWYEGEAYEIDLSDTNLRNLREAQDALKAYADKGRLADRASVRAYQQSQETEPEPKPTPLPEPKVFPEVRDEEGRAVNANELWNLILEKLPNGQFRGTAAALLQTLGVVPESWKANGITAALRRLLDTRNHSLVEYAPTPMLGGAVTFEIDVNDSVDLDKTNTSIVGDESIFLERLFSVEIEEMPTGKLFRRLDPDGELAKLKDGQFPENAAQLGAVLMDITDDLRNEGWEIVQHRQGSAIKWTIVPPHLPSKHEELFDTDPDKEPEPRSRVRRGDSSAVNSRVWMGKAARWLKAEGHIPHDYKGRISQEKLDIYRAHIGEPLVGKKQPKRGRGRGKKDQ